MMSALTPETLNWIKDICDRFTEVTEWPLFFTEYQKNKKDYGNHDECCWCQELKCGNSRIGYFHIDLPGNSQSDRFFLTVKEMAEMMVNLVEEVLTGREQIQTRTNDVNTLAQIGLTIVNEKDLFKALHKLLKAAVQLSGYISASFFLLNPKRDQMSLRGQYKTGEYSNQFSLRKIEDDAPDFQAIKRSHLTIQKSEDENAARLWLPKNAQTGFCCPIVTTDGPLGTLWVYDRRKKIPTERDQHILMSVAAQIASLLERVVLLQESSEQHRIVHDLRIASETQTHGRISDDTVESGFEIAAVCSSRYEIGGDLFELIPIDQNRTVITIGDASGDSVPAAMVMSSVRGALRMIATDPNQDMNHTDLIMQKINSTLYSITPAHQFMSMLFAVYDKSTGLLTYTNAGHPTPILCHNDQITTLQSHGMLLGVMPDVEYEKSVISMNGDDILIMYSDGISEAMNGKKKLFRSEGIIGAVKHFDSGTSAETILNKILSQVEEHTNGHGGDDDRTLLVIRTQMVQAESKSA